MERRILHLRVISFAVAVARVRDPSLGGKPVVVAAGTGPRAVVLAASEEARGDGVIRGLLLSEALRRCRRAVLLPPDPDLYARASAAVASVLARYAPVVEPHPGGRLFADLTGTRRLFGAAMDVAARVQKEVRERFRLPANAGVAVNKLVSGVAARVLRPVGLCDVLPGGEEAFLSPVAVGNLPAVDPEVEGRLLADLNVIRVGQLAALPLASLTMAFGRAGGLLYRQARGVDDAPVRPPSCAVVVEETAPLAEDTNDDASLLSALYGLIERGCRRLRRMGGLAGEAALSARYSDGTQTMRRVPLRPPLDLDFSLFARLRPAFEGAVSRRGRVRSLTLRLSRIDSAPAQMRLFPEMDGDAAGAGRERGDVAFRVQAATGTIWAGERGSPRLDVVRERALVAALDHLRGRYGEEALLCGRALRN